ALPFFSNPIYARPVNGYGYGEDEDVPVRILKDPYTREVSELFDEIYMLMLRMLQFVFSNPTAERAQVEWFSMTAIGIMPVVVKPLGEALTLLASGCAEGETAGPSFRMSRHVPLPADVMIAHRIAVERLKQLAAEAVRLSRDPRSPNQLAAAASNMQQFVDAADGNSRIHQFAPPPFLIAAGCNPGAPAESGKNLNRSTPENGGASDARKSAEDKKRELEIKKLERELSYTHLLLQPGILFPAVVGLLGLGAAYLNGWFDVSLKELKAETTLLEIDKRELVQATQKLVQEKAGLESQKVELSEELGKGEERLAYLNAFFESGATCGPFNEYMSLTFYNPRDEIVKTIGHIKAPKALLQSLRASSDEPVTKVRDSIGSILVDERPFDQEDLSIISSLPSLSTLALHTTSPGTLSFVPLIETKLKSLNLREMELTEKSLKTIAAIESLEHVVLDRCRLQDVWLKHLGALKNLNMLVLDNVGINGSGLTELARSERLESLSLSGESVTVLPKSAIEDGFSQLRDLRLFETGVTDFKGLGKLKALQFLIIIDSPVNESLIGELKSLEHLRSISWTENMVETAVSTEIKKQFPALQIK
ncbi:MAG: hypothetical protein WD851_18570, partial [Pirellulales bacterium]